MEGELQREHAHARVAGVEQCQESRELAGLVELEHFRRRQSPTMAPTQRRGVATSAPTMGHQHRPPRPFP